MQETESELVAESRPAACNCEARESGARSLHALCRAGVMQEAGLHASMNHVHNHAHRSCHTSHLTSLTQCLWRWRLSQWANNAGGSSPPC